MPHPSCWIIHVSIIPGNDMNMDMAYGLTGCMSNIESYIESIRVIFIHKEGFYPGHQFPDILHLFWSHIEVVRNVPFRDDQHMSSADRKFIIYGYCQFRLSHQFAAQIAEWTCFFFHFIMDFSREKIPCPQSGDY